MRRVFYRSNDNLYVNEIAPRVHNSGHLTINAFNVSQFENHVRAVCSLEQIPLKKLYNAEMINLIGCSKENFYELMKYMDYKKDKSTDTYIFRGEKRKKEKIIRFDKKENPFKKLLSLNLK